MKRTSLAHDLFRVLSPGRRKLWQRQEARRDEQMRELQQLLHEYRSLAELHAQSCYTNALREFNYGDFSRFIRADERLKSWTLAQNEIREFDIPEMVGGVNPGDQRLIFHLHEYLRPFRVLEIGTHIGASTIHIAAALNALPDGRSRKLVTVDIKDVNCRETKPWLKVGSRYSPLEMITKLHCREIVDFVTQPSVEFLKGNQQKYDLIFLDGDHASKAVYQEIPLSLNHLSPGGCILLHDYFPNLQPLWGPSDNASGMSAAVIPGPYLAVQRLLLEGCEFFVEPFGALPWNTKLGSNITSLALISRLKCP